MFVPVNISVRREKEGDDAAKDQNEFGTLVA